MTGPQVDNRAALQPQARNNVGVQRQHKGHILYFLHNHSRIHALSQESLTRRGRLTLLTHTIIHDPPSPPNALTPKGNSQTVETDH